eukprot:gene17847-24931_t
MSIAIFQRYTEYKLIFSESVKLFEEILMIAASICIGFILLGQVLHGKCDSSYALETLSCNDSVAFYRILPQGSLTVSMLAPLINSSLFSSSWEVVIFCWINSIIFMIVTLFISKSYATITSVFFYIPISLLILLENRRRHLTHFKIVNNLRESSQKYSLLVNEQSKEMRYIIGNVAHDIKTPLSAFLSGVDCISCEIDDVISIIKSNGNFTIMDDPNESGNLYESDRPLISSIIIEKLQNVTSYSKSLKHIN